jgi:hypothetical protein
VQPRRLADLAQGQARLAGALEGFPACDAGLVALAVQARELRLSTLYLGAGFSLASIGALGSLFVRSL